MTPGMTVATVHDAVKRIEAAFWARYHGSEGFRKALAGKDRRILLAIDGEPHAIIVANGRIVETRGGPVEKPDVVIRAARDDFLDIVNGRVGPLVAYAQGRLKVTGKLRDLLLVKAFL